MENLSFVVYVVVDSIVEIVWRICLVVFEEVVGGWGCCGGRSTVIRSTSNNVFNGERALRSVSPWGGWREFWSTWGVP